MTYDEALKYAMNGEGVFLIGSGFSVGAYNCANGEDKKLWVGTRLAEELADLTEMDRGVQLDIVSQEYIDIYGEKALVNYLKEHYTVDEYADYYKVIAKMKNIRVYSTNYDNLIEKVCEDCGSKVKGYSIDADIRKVNKDKMVMHLNGYIGDLKDNVLPESFKLTHLSYNNTSFFNTPWYSYLIDEIHSAKVVFIIGLSFSSDLDIRRIVSNSELKEKIFFVERADLSVSNRKFLDKYGRVLLCGVKKFMEDLDTVKIEEEKKQVYFKSFKKAIRYKNSTEIEDKNVYELFFKGKEVDELYSKDEKRQYKALVNREKVIDVVDGLRKGKSYIIHSDLGNGKSIFVNQIIDLCSDMEFYFIRQVLNPKILPEIRNLCSDEKVKVIVCDPVNLFIDNLKKFVDFDLANIRFLFIARSSMYDNYYNNIFDLIDNMKNTQFANSICLDELTENELIDLNRVISTYGFYGDIAGESNEKKLDYLKNKCNSRFQSILLYLFESMHIIERFVDDIGNLREKRDLRRILILSFVSSILELGLGIEDYRMLLQIDDIERVIKRSNNCGELIDIERGEIAVKSSIIAKELMMKTEVFSKDEVFEVLTIVMQKLDDLYLGSEKYKNAMINLVSCSYISYVFGFKMDSGKLIEYYEKAKELKFCKNNLFFWEQYAIVCVNLNQFDRAERYFKTAYSLAKSKGKMFSAYQIDNHFARYLLENQLYYRKSENSLEVFLEAHRLLNKNSEVEKNKRNSRYYKFRVARAYKDYYDVFACKYSSEDKDIFIRRCQEMLFSLRNYKKGMNENEIRKDVRECENGLKYILTSENINI